MFRLATRWYSVSAARTVTNLNDLGKLLPNHVASFVKEKAELCQAKDVHVCDGSDNEYQSILYDLESQGLIKRLRKYENCWLVRTDPADVARVESKTFVSSRNRRDTIPDTPEGVPSQLGNWLSIEDLHKAWNERFPGCMNGRTMYVIPFSMGPIGSPLSKIGIELTDSPYVVACMKIMTRMGSKVTESLGNGEFVKCLHSIGQPLPMKTPAVQGWPCNPEKTIITHLPETNEISSFGSGYGGNSLLGKKGLALRLGSVMAEKEGWLAEHCMIIAITAPNGNKRYVAAAFPSACGKTNLAMLVPTLPGYKIETVGDDIAWMRFDSEGRLRAINPEAGFFGVAPGTSHKTNTLAMHTIERNTIFTNTAETADGGFYWEGLEHELPDHMEVIDWKGKHWDRHGKEPAAHPNSRFCTPIEQLPILDRQAWEGSEGVPIDAIIFGGRRPEGVPLVYEAFDWEHGVFVGANMRSESTAAAEHKAKVIMHDPFAMRPFFGYNFGDYVKHWLSMPTRCANPKLPKIYHVNWFRRSPDGGFLWPGFSENCRVLDWIMRRVDGEENIAEKSPVGWLPKKESFRLEGLDPNKPIDWNSLFSISKDFWMKEAEEVGQYFQQQVGSDLPDEMWKQRDMLLERLQKI